MSKNRIVPVDHIAAATEALKPQQKQQQNVPSQPLPNTRDLSWRASLPANAANDAV